MISYTELLSETLNVTSPIFTLVFAGWVLAKIGWLSQQFVNSASNLIFSLFLPVLIFNAIINMDVKADMDWTIVLYTWGVSAVTFLIAWGLVAFTPLKHQVPADKGVFVQGAFRSNLGIIGIALCINSYGNAGIGQAALLLAMVTPIFNVLSVIVLSHYQNSDSALDLKQLTLNIAKNPLIIAIAIALPLSFLEFSLPTWAAKSVESVSNMTLPLALLCIGGSLDLKALKGSSVSSLLSTVLRLFVFPAIAAFGAILMGFEAMTIGIIFLMFASPTAAASFVMAKAMKGNATLAANIIALTTVVSAFSVSLGLFVLKSLGFA